jgi:hypothetical protein
MAMNTPNTMETVTSAPSLIVHTPLWLCGRKMWRLEVPTEGGLLTRQTSAATGSSHD